MNRHITQKQQIAQYLLEGNSITPIEALNMFGCFRLAAVIFDIKKEYEWDVTSTMIVEEDGKRYASYKLAEKGGEK